MPSREQLAEWDREQLALASQVIDADDAGGALAAAAAAGENGATAGPPLLVGGLDIAYADDADGDGSGGNGSSSGSGDGKPCSAVAALAVLSLPGLALRHTELLETQPAAPYAPGYLGFREVPAYLQLLANARASGVAPDVVLVDGAGRLHPRRAGAACQLGVLAGVPAVGVAKSLVRVEGVPNEREARAAIDRSGSFWLALGTAPDGSGGAPLGAAVRAAPGTKRPLYVSVGHRVSLETAIALVRRCCITRVPEPVRRADMLARAALKAATRARGGRVRGADEAVAPAVATAAAAAAAAAATARAPA